MNCNRSTPLVMFLTGLGTGIGLATLLAPRSGRDTSPHRRKVEEGEDWIEEPGGRGARLRQESGWEIAQSRQNRPGRLD
jgi:hypothetical protein